MLFEQETIWLLIASYRTVEAAVGAVFTPLSRRDLRASHIVGLLVTSHVCYRYIGFDWNFNGMTTKSLFLVL